MVSLLPSFVARKKRYVSFHKCDFYTIYYSLCESVAAWKGKKYYSIFFSSLYAVQDRRRYGLSDAGIGQLFEGLD